MYKYSGQGLLWSTQIYNIDQSYYCHLNKGSNSKKTVLLKHVRNYICLFSTDMQLIEDAVQKKNLKTLDYFASNYSSDIL